MPSFRNVKELEKHLKKKLNQSIRIGYFTDKYYESTYNVHTASLFDRLNAAEYGVASRGVPPRPIMPLMMKTLENNKNAILEDIGTIRLEGDLGDEVEEKLYSNAEEIKTQIQYLFDSQGDGYWVPLKEKTIKLKGSSDVLIDTGTLRDSIEISEVEYDE